MRAYACRLDLTSVRLHLSQLAMSLEASADYSKNLLRSGGGDDSGGGGGGRRGTIPKCFALVDLHQAASPPLPPGQSPPRASDPGPRGPSLRPRAPTIQHLQRAPVQVHTTRYLKKEIAKVGGIERCLPFLRLGVAPAIAGASLLLLPPTSQKTLNPLNPTPTLPPPP